ncbi:hypothetical protein LY78DRAFT_385726 [Colletotrichum sublineola]|nr:hypothetical protein LY78DRAFT_385726 [Colletotrichum sublineola]
MRTTSGSMSSLFFSLGILFRADYSAIPAPSFMSNGVSMSRNPELRPGAAPNSSPQCRPRYLGNTPTDTLSPLRHPFPYHFMLPPCRTSPPSPVLHSQSGHGLTSPAKFPRAHNQSTL